MKRRDFLLSAAGAAAVSTTACTAIDEPNPFLMLAAFAPRLFIGLHLDNGIAFGILNLLTGAVLPASILRNKQTLAMLVVFLVVSQFLLEEKKNGRKAITATPRLYITLRDNTLAVVDPETMAVLATIQLGQVPAQIAASPATDFLAISNNGSHSVAIVSTAENRVLRTIPLDANSYPFGVAVLQDGRVYAVSEGLNRIYVLDSNAGTVLTTINLSNGASKIGLSPDGSTAWAATSSGNIHVIDTLSNTISITLTSVASPVAVAFNPTGTRAFVTSAPAGQAGSVVVIDTATFEVLNRFTVGQNPYAITVNPAGTELYISNFDSNSISTINLLTNQVTDTIATGPGPIETALLS